MIKKEELVELFLDSARNTIKENKKEIVKGLMRNTTQEDTYEEIYGQMFANVIEIAVSMAVSVTIDGLCETNLISKEALKRMTIKPNIRLVKDEEQEE